MIRAGLVLFAGLALVTAVHAQQGTFPTAAGGGGSPAGTSGQVQTNNGSGGFGALATTGSGNVVLSTSPILLTPTLGAASLTSGAIGGTAGAGYIEFSPQSVAPGTPAANTFRVFADAAGKFNWIGANGWTRTFDGSANTANHTYTLPDADGTITALGNAATGSGSVVLATSPTLVTPTLGAATATTLNKFTFSAPATGITIAGTDGTTITLPSATATLPGLGIANAWTSSNTYSGALRLNSSLQGSAGRALITTTAPTVTTQFTSTGSATVTNNSSAAIVVALPATGTANTGAAAGVLTFAAATTGYVCMASDRTTPAVSIVQTGTTTTTATFQVTGSPTNADVYQFLCTGY